MKIRFKIPLYLFLLSTSLFHSQKAAVSNGDKKYNRYAYIDAIKIYEKVVAKGYGNSELYQKIGNAYFFNSDFIAANKWYEKLFSMPEKKIDSEYYYRFAQTLKATGYLEKATLYEALFVKNNTTDCRAKLVKENPFYRKEIEKRANSYSMKPASINSKYSDYGGAFYKDTFIFTSTRDTGNVSNKKHLWTNQSFSNLYQASYISDGELTNPKPLNRRINSKFNESSAIFSKDGTTLYFTGNNYTNRKKKSDANGIVLLKIYKATFLNGKWSAVTEVSFNNNAFNCAHPALSPDEKTLYFASNMPGTLGQSDIFKVAINDDGSFGIPQNLGFPINTEGKETFPFVSQNNELYFASDGHPGLGGLDVFATKLFEDGSHSKIYNLGVPINSVFDDFAFVTNANQMGFVSSNRTSGKGYDDIYQIKAEKLLPFNLLQILSGTVTLENATTPAPPILVRLLDADKKELACVFSDKKGNFTFKDQESDTDYEIKIEAPSFESVTITVLANENQIVLLEPTVLVSTVKKVVVGTDLAQLFKIQNIFFDLDKSNIRRDAVTELQKIVVVLNENPTMKVAIQSHTDSRQTATYNQILSEKRAQATKNWLEINGIAASRITATGCGESQLKNKCTNGIKCAEAAHQENRRSEFIVTEL